MLPHLLNSSTRRQSVSVLQEAQSKENNEVDPLDGQLGQKPVNKWAASGTALWYILHGFLVALKQDRVPVALGVNLLTLNPFVVFWVSSSSVFSGLTIF